MIRLLILEDEPLIAEMLVSWAREMGCAVVGPAASVEDSLQLIEKGRVDLALLDICVTDGDSYPLAERLKVRNIPFVFATGLSDTSIDPVYADVPVAPKPFEFDQLQATMFALVCSHGTSSHDARALMVSLPQE